LGTIRLVDVVAVSRATSTGLLAVTTFGLRLGRLGPYLGQISAELPN
jgi:hypothetical protein